MLQHSRLLLLVIAVLLFASLCFAADYYKVLGVSRSATEDQIKRAYRKLAVKYHPDKNAGNKEAEKKFMEIAAAYEVLSNPQKKSTYDRFGEEGLKNAGAQQHNPTDVFSQFFGFNFGGQNFGMENTEEDEFKGPEITMPLEVTLEDIYNGHVITFNRVKVAHKEGAKPRKCECRNKVVRMTIQMGGMVKQVTENKCDECRDRFEVEQVTSQLLVDVERGMKDGEQLTYFGEGDANTEHEAGDLNFVIRTAPHDRFIRQGNDLKTKMVVTLKEALVGFEKHITHLDGRKISISASQVIRPGFVERIKGEGMPLRESPDTKGDLFVEFDVVFPTTLSASQVADLKRIL